MDTVTENECSYISAGVIKSNRPGMTIAQFSKIQSHIIPPGEL